MENKFAWSAELVFKPKTLSKDLCRRYFNLHDYEEIKKELSIQRNHTDLFSKKINYHTLINLEETLMDEEFEGDLSDINKFLYDWQVDIQCFTSSGLIPFNKIIESSKLAVIRSILYKGVTSGYAWLV